MKDDTMNFDKQKLKETLQAYRQSVMILFLTIAGALFIELTGVEILEMFDIKVAPYNRGLYLFVLGCLISVASFLNKYLGGGDLGQRVKPELNNSETSTTGVSEATGEALNSMRGEFASLRGQIESAVYRLNNSADAVFDAQEKNEIVAAIMKKIFSDASSELLNEIYEKVRTVQERQSAVRLKSHFSGTIKRLSGEIDALAKRARVNLIIGAITALTGVSIFMMFVLQRAPQSAADSYLITEFAPRISLVIVIEVFAYFFLGLYKNNLSEIKYFHNELTNTEQKYVAIDEALAFQDGDTVKAILTEFSKTERNFLLKKGESTVSIEDKKMAIEEHKNMLSTLISSFRSGRK